MRKTTTPPLFRALSVVWVFALIVLQLLLMVPQVSAAQITNRSLTLMAGAGGDGGSKPSGVVNHWFQFTIPTTGTAIGSIKFEYCTTAADSPSNPTCVTPTGLDTTLAGAVLGSEAGSGATGFSLNKTTNGGCASAATGCRSS